MPIEIHAQTHEIRTARNTIADAKFCHDHPEARAWAWKILTQRHLPTSHVLDTLQAVLNHGTQHPLNDARAHVSQAENQHHA